MVGGRRQDDQRPRKRHHPRRTQDQRASSHRTRGRWIRYPR
jgi:hypothetical protein